jgi:hypothetical protein
MEEVQSSHFVGKTIQSISTESVNVIHFTFTDGTKLSLWTEPCGIADLSGFMVSEYEDPKGEDVGE